MTTHPAVDNSLRRKEDADALRRLHATEIQAYLEYAARKFNKNADGASWL